VLTEKDREAMEEIRAIHSRMQDLQKVAAAAKSNVSRKEAALSKAQKNLEEARSELQEAESAVTAFAPEQRKAAQKMITLMGKSPDMVNDLLTSALNIAPSEA